MLLEFHWGWAILFAVILFLVSWILLARRLGMKLQPAMARVQSHSTSNATSIAQWASLQALLDGPEELERRRLAFQERRDAIHEGLDALDGVRCSRPRGAFYIFPDVSGLFGRSDGERTLRSEGVVRQQRPNRCDKLSGLRGIVQCADQ